MRGHGSFRILAAAICAAVGLLGLAASAQGAASDPLFVFTPKGGTSPPILPPPAGALEGPCGLAVDESGSFYVSDYYHDAVDVYDANADYNSVKPPVTGATGYISQYAGIDPIDGPCGLALDASGNLYVNDYHRAVIRYPGATTITGATTPEETHPTGVATDTATGNVYVDQSDHVSVFDSSGQPVMSGLPGFEVPLQIANGSLNDGYGIAFSQYPATQGRLYLPDAATDTVKVYDATTPNAGPIEEIDGSETPAGEFVSLRDASIAVDRVSGEIYVVDDLQPEYTERPQAIVDVFHPDGTYEGHLKRLIAWGMPAGLAVDNSTEATQGRVYVTSGNSTAGSIYAYGPGAATTAPIALPALGPPPLGESGALSAEAGAQPCGSCEKAPIAPAGAPAEASSAGQAPAAALPRQRARKKHRRAGQAHRPRRAHHKAHRAHHKRVASTR